MLTKKYNQIVNTLSFNKKLRDMRKEINFRIDLPESITFYPDSNPKGFVKEFKKRRTTIVESYLKITKDLDSASYNRRINALKLLEENINYSGSLKMPLNTARVQLALMKEVTKTRNNKRVQLELMRDFTTSTFGHPRVIRKLLKRFDIIEVPETGEELKDLKMGWDFHVHDHTSYGRKSPMQLIIDAFIKGISELTVVYTNFKHEKTVEEVLEAGKILGIKINIGIEFSSVVFDKKFHFIYILPEFASDKKKFKHFIKTCSGDLADFSEQLSKNDKRRRKIVQRLIDHFNITYLPVINKNYQPDSIYYLEPIQLTNNSESDVNKIFSSRQLGELVYPQLRKVIENRALRLMALRRRIKLAPEQFTKQQIIGIEAEYNENKKYYDELDPELIRIRYFSEFDRLDTETAVDDLKAVHSIINKTGGSIKFIQPVEHGLQAAIDIIIEYCQYFSHTEVFNIYDTIGAKESDFITLTNFIGLMNKCDKNEITEFLNNNNLTYSDKKIDKALLHLKEKNLIPAIGSDATGRSTLAPGMGFVTENQLQKKQRKYFKKQHYNLPQDVSQLVHKYSPIPKSTLKPKEKANIICLGKVDTEAKHQIGEEKTEKPIKLTDAWTYLNPTIKNLIFAILGFIPAYMYFGASYACLWFFITGTRNIFVDVISGNGLIPTSWQSQNINWANLAHSLFWTGFSVPILGFVKDQFDLIWVFEHSGAVYEGVKFFFINMTNGLYLASHNYLRGFDKATIRGNLFRSIIAWPFATAFSPIGNALGIPSIVQAKFWSDFVAALIEGTTKYNNVLKLKSKIVSKLIPDFKSDNEETVNLATLDLLYLVDESNNVKTSFYKQSFEREKFKQRALNFLKGKRSTSKPKDIFFSVKQHFLEKDNYNKLTKFVISNYNKDQSLFLLQIMSKNYDKFTNWLLSLERRTLL